MWKNYFSRHMICYHVHRGSTECCRHHVVLKVPSEAKVSCVEREETNGTLSISCPLQNQSNDDLFGDNGATYRS